MVTEFGEDLGELGIVRKGFASLHDQGVSLVALFGVFRVQGCEAFLRRGEIREATQNFGVGSGCSLGFATLEEDRGPSHQRGDIVRVRFKDFVDLRFSGDEVGSLLIERCHRQEQFSVARLAGIWGGREDALHRLPRFAHFSQAIGSPGKIVEDSGIVGEPAGAFLEKAVGPGEIAGLIRHTSQKAGDFRVVGCELSRLPGKLESLLVVLQRAGIQLSQLRGG